MLMPPFLFSTTLANARRRKSATSTCGWSKRSSCGCTRRERERWAHAALQSDAAEAAAAREHQDTLARAQALLQSEYELAREEVDRVQQRHHLISVN